MNPYASSYALNSAIKFPFDIKNINDFSNIFQQIFNMLSKNVSTIGLEGATDTESVLRRQKQNQMAQLQNVQTTASLLSPILSYIAESALQKQKSAPEGVGGGVNFLGSPNFESFTKNWGEPTFSNYLDMMEQKGNLENRLANRRWLQSAGNLFDTFRYYKTQAGRDSDLRRIIEQLFGVSGR